MQDKVTVCIVDDQKDVIDALGYVIKQNNYLVTTYSSAQAFLDNYQPNQMTCLLLDICMPEMPGLELQQELLKQGKMLPIICMTGYGDVSTAVQAMKGGAVEFLTKPIDIDLLLQTLAEITEQMVIQVEANQQRAYAEALVQRLTQREREILCLIVKGKLNKVIAHELAISMSTVELHRASIMRKMETKKLAELVRLVTHFDLIN